MQESTSAQSIVKLNRLLMWNVVNSTVQKETSQVVLPNVVKTSQKSYQMKHASTEQIFQCLFCSDYDDQQTQIFIWA